MSMPRAAMSVATRARMSPLLKPASAWVRAPWLLLPCSAIAWMRFFVRYSATLLAPNLVRVNTSTWLQLCSLMMCTSSAFFLPRPTGWITWLMRCTVVLRGVTWMCSGSFNSALARSRISSLKVAENSRLCFSLGTRARIFFTSWMKPMSSMRSASSSTSICTPERSRKPCCCRSSRRPGHATEFALGAFALAQQVQQGQGEGGGLAGAGLGTTEQIAPGQHGGNRLGLDGGGGFVTVLAHSLHDGRGQIQFFEVHCLMRRPSRALGASATPAAVLCVGGRRPVSLGLMDSQGGWRPVAGAHPQHCAGAGPTEVPNSRYCRMLG